MFRFYHPVMILPTAQPRNPIQAKVSSRPVVRIMSLSALEVRFPPTTEASGDRRTFVFEASGNVVLTSSLRRMLRRSTDCICSPLS